MSTSPTNLEITLKEVFDDSDVLEAFVEFCKVQHASENLDFYNAVTKYKDDFVTILKEEGKEVQPRKTQVNQGTILQKLFGKKFTPSEKSEKKAEKMVDKAREHRRSVERPASPMGTVASTKDERVLKLASQIYSEFLTEDSPSWVCISLETTKQIKDVIEGSTALKITIFDEAQKQVFANMESDLLPRFTKAFNSSVSGGTRNAQSDGSALNKSSERNVGSLRYQPTEEMQKRFEKLKIKKSGE